MSQTNADRLRIIEQADWIIDLGPDGGKNGGEVVFTGRPAQLLATEGSLTGEFLRRHVETGAAASTP